MNSEGMTGGQEVKESGSIFMMASPTYSGSRLLLPLTEITGIPLDQVNFVAAQLTALLFGFGLRFLLPHSLGKPRWRSLYCLLAGLYMLWFMIGWYTGLVLFQVMVCYLLTKVFPQNYTQMAVFTFALGYMLTLYVLRLFERFEDLCYDATYPLMITTQKLTALAFSVSDGNLLFRKGKKLNEEREKWAVKNEPSFLEYCAYVLSFQGVLAGPFCHYNVYRAFIEGNTSERLQENRFPVVYKDDVPSCLRAVIRKLCAVAFWVVITAWVKPHFPDNTNADPEFIARHNMATRIGYLYISLLFHRAKYYVTWILADAVCNSSGMGYAGKDEKGRHQWTAMSSVFVLKIETATSLKTYMDNWNILTTHWLRYVCYTRAPFLNTLLTFCLSAAWHGLFIGYYVTFVSAAFTVEAARKFRAVVRPKFQSSQRLRVIYEIVTWVSTHLSISFLVLSFVILRWEPTVRFHSSFYWSFHIIVAIMLLVLPSRRSSSSKQQQNDHQKKVEDEADQHHQKKIQGDSDHQFHQNGTGTKFTPSNCQNSDSARNNEKHEHLENEKFIGRFPNNVNERNNLNERNNGGPHYTKERSYEKHSNSSL